MSRAAEGREKQRIGIFGTGLSYAGSYGRVTSESSGRDLNPLGRGAGQALVAGSVNLGRLAPTLRRARGEVAQGNSANNQCMGGGVGGLGGYCGSSYGGSGIDSHALDWTYDPPKWRDPGFDHPLPPPYGPKPPVVLPPGLTPPVAPNPFPLPPLGTAPTCEELLRCCLRQLQEAGPWFLGDPYTLSCCKMYRDLCPPKPPSSGVQQMHLTTVAYYNDFCEDATEAFQNIQKGCATLGTYGNVVPNPCAGLYPSQATEADCRVFVDHPEDVVNDYNKKCIDCCDVTFASIGDPGRPSPLCVLCCDTMAEPYRTMLDMCCEDLLA